GTRLWPLSRALYPKQLIDLYNEHTMLQNTLRRLSGIADLAPPVVVCNETHRFMTAEQLRLIDTAASAILLEPAGRNTAPAIALAALITEQLQSKSGTDASDPVLLVLPADHVIENITAFHKGVAEGAELAQQGHLVTFGIVPGTPETGYGYIQKGDPLNADTQAARIARFVEKPDYKTACDYLASGNFCWNSGMFMFKTSVITSELGTHAPDIMKGCKDAIDKGRQDLDFFRVDQESFESIQGDSIDYAVMEKTDKGVVIPLDAGWNDLGSFDALWQTGTKDEENNVTSGDVLVHNV
ncbi:MAG TPA: mannose-1-phosphate guanylyltransferase/mannose-6-phosphate isomerase, partial [Desulfobacteraceae bacterium]|nr:mannose-1-phosphate guanylyltransferase/mannose-6-phosphate isomerase [Desulfobacteraceae bacterium]